MKKYDRFFLICGSAMLLSELWKQFCLTYIVNNGCYNWWYFPFQLCSIPMYVCLILPWVKSTRVHAVLLSFLMDFALLGGIFTFFDTSGLHYSYAPLTVHSFAWHILLIVIGLAAGLSRRADYSKRGYGWCIFLYLACCAIATIFNLALYQYGPINMFYISPHYYLTQIVFVDIARVIGNIPGIFVYAGAIIAGAGILHLAWHQTAGRFFKNCCSKTRASTGLPK